jgi:hypothetical protein
MHAGEEKNQASIIATMASAQSVAELTSSPVEHRSFNT